MRGDFSLDDFLALARQVDPLVAGVGLSESDEFLAAFEQRWPATLSQIQRVVREMTSQERFVPAHIDSVRRIEIANRCGMKPEQLDLLIAEFCRVQASAQQMAGMSQRQRVELVFGLRRLFEPG